MNDTIHEWDDWWRAVAHHYQHRMRVHDLGHGHKEVLITRSDRWAHTPELTASELKAKGLAAFVVK